MRDWALIAEIGKTKTLQGGLVVRSIAGLPFLLQEGMDVVFVPPQIDTPRTATVVSLQFYKDDSYLASFSSVPDIDTAQALVGCYCLVKRDVLPKDFDEMTDQGFRGFTVVDVEFGALGLVNDFQENKMQSLLYVTGDFGEILIPWVDEFIIDVDEDEMFISTKIPRGLIDLSSRTTLASNDRIQRVAPEYPHNEIHGCDS